MFMMIKENCIGACIVLENYLDGAIADYEYGDVENVSVIDDCINALRLLGDSSCKDYKERVDKVKERMLEE